MISDAGSFKMKPSTFDGWLVVWVVRVLALGAKEKTTREPFLVCGCVAKR